MTKKEEREAKKLEKLRLEKERMYEMFSFEREYGNHQAICGIDEVGRGPFAGPVVAAAVILPKDCDILYLNDSKKLSEKKRELLYDEIYEKNPGWFNYVKDKNRSDTYKEAREYINLKNIVEGNLKEE